MYLDEIIEKLMDLDEQTVPCECGIPCHYYNPQANGSYCYRGSCLEGMVRTIRDTVRKESR